MLMNKTPAIMMTVIAGRMYDRPIHSWINGGVSIVKQTDAIVAKKKRMLNISSNTVSILEVLFSAMRSPTPAAVLPNTASQALRMPLTIIR